MAVNYRSKKFYKIGPSFLPLWDPTYLVSTITKYILTTTEGNNLKLFSRVINDVPL